MKRIINYLFIALLLYISNSCNLDGFNFDKMSGEVALTPKFVIPIANADISIWDIIESVNDENDTLMKVGDDDVIKIVYSQEDIYNYEIRNLLDLPQQRTLANENEPIGNLSMNNETISRTVTLRQITDEVDGDIDNIVELEGQTKFFPATVYQGSDAEFSVENSDIFTTVTVATGDLDVKLTNNLKWIAMSLEGEFYDQQNDQVIAIFNFTNLNAGNFETQTFALDGKTISNDIVFKMTRFETFASIIPVPINLEDNFELAITFRDMKISSGNIKLPEQLVEGLSGSMNFDFDDGIKVFETGFKYGTIDISYQNTSELTGIVNMVFPDITKNGSALSFRIPTGGSDSETLAGTIIKFANNETAPFNKIEYEYSIELNASSGFVNFNSSDLVSIAANLNNLEFQTIKGDFGNKNIPIDQGEFNIEMAFLDKIEGGFQLANPQLQLIFNNHNVGLPAQVETNFTAQNTSGDIVNLEPLPFALTPPGNITDTPIEQVHVIDQTNSNIIDFIALPPSGNISYSGNITFNPEGEVEPSVPNFLDMDGSLQIDLAIEMPFELQVSDLTFQDTAKVNGEDLDMIKSAELIINARNGIPLDIELEMFFVDTLATDGSYFSKTNRSKVLDAARVSELGAILTTESSNTIELSEQELEGLKDANGIIMKGYISSPKEGEEIQVARIEASSTLEINLVIKSDLDL